ncbi:MAG TPA: VTT domain-containing protein [Gemmatimonadota bacterium]|nr:VTT domain-containing protein [Gemmatimonadota bacterium]
MSDSAALAGKPFSVKQYDRLPWHVYVLGAVIILIGIATFILMSIKGDERHGYLYLFFYSIPANTAISVFPHEPVLILYGKFANLWMTAVAATGGTIVAGWLDHRVFVPVLNHSKLIGYKDSRFYKKMTDMFMKYPFVTLLITGFTPIPFWPFKLLVFSIHYPLWKYVTALVVARFPRYLFLAWAGSMFDIPNWVLIGVVIFIFGSYAVKAVPELWRKIRELRRRRERGDEYRV